MFIFIQILYQKTDGLQSRIPAALCFLFTLPFNLSAVMEAEYQKSVWTMPYAIISLNIHTITHLSHDYCDIHTITVDIHTNTFSGNCPKKC